MGLTIAVLGLGFGESFVPIYLSHPAVDRVVVVEPDDRRRRVVAERFAIETSYRGFDEVLADVEVDAVHVLAPVHFHADYACQVLDAGKHCASAVPMATSLDDLGRVIAAEARSGKRYMMMETAIYGREFLAAAELYAAGDFGGLTFYRGFHVQNLDGYPVYWQGFPPMHYLTHALSPALALLGTRVTSVRAHGSGRLAPERTTGGFNNPFPTEVGHFRLAGSDVIAEILMSFSQTARGYVEGFSVYGEKLGLEWPVDQVGPMIMHRMSGPAEGSRGNTVITEPFEPRDFDELLPSALASFVRPGVVQLPGMGAPVRYGAGHSGSHPFLVDEFVRAIVEDRPAAIDAVRAAELTAPGICAHQSALRDGELVEVPAYR